MVEEWSTPHYYSDKEHLANIYRYDIEVSLLVGLMLNLHAWRDMPECEELEPNDFVRPLHGAIFSVIKTLQEANQKPNFFTVGLHFAKAFPGYYDAIDGNRWFCDRAHEYYWFATSSKDNLAQWTRDIKHEADECRLQMGLPIQKSRRRKGVEL